MPFSLSMETRWTLKLKTCVNFFPYYKCPLNEHDTSSHNNHQPMFHSISNTSHKTQQKTRKLSKLVKQWDHRTTVNTYRVLTSWKPRGNWWRDRNQEKRLFIDVKYKTPIQTARIHFPAESQSNIQ